MLFNISFSGLDDLSVIFMWITILPVVLTLLFLVLRLWLHKTWLRLLISFLFLLNAATAFLCFRHELGFYGIGMMNVIAGFAALIVAVRDWTWRGEEMK